MNSSTLVSRIVLGTVIGLGSLALSSGVASASPECQPGFRPGIYGCDDINECWEGLDNCSADAACVNRIGSFTCSCNPGFEGDGVTCTAPAPAVPDECASAADCEPNMACVTGDGPAYCACKPGYRDGIYGCDDINECWEGTDNCSDNAACTNRMGSFTCRCNTGFKGNGVTCTSSAPTGTVKRSRALGTDGDDGGGADDGDDCGSSLAEASDAADGFSARDAGGEDAADDDADDDDDASDDDSGAEVTASTGLCAAGPGGADPSAIGTLLAAAAIIVSRRRKS